MENINQASENDGKNTAAVKRNAGYRFLKSNAKTPFSYLQDQTNVDEDSAFMKLDSAYGLIEILENKYTYQYYKDKKALHPISEKKMEELVSYSKVSSVSDLIIEMSTPASQLIKEMEENQKPILCVDAATVNLACMLIHARTQSTLLSKHWKEIPNGKELSMLADERFEELCSKMKIPRRTRTIMDKKKVEKETNNENSNSKNS